MDTSTTCTDEEVQGNGSLVYPEAKFLKSHFIISFHGFSNKAFPSLSEASIHSPPSSSGGSLTQVLDLLHLATALAILHNSAFLAPLSATLSPEH